jgi:four helix bundle protein
MATARRFEELAVWQLSAELRDRVVAATGAPDLRDRAFVGQLEGAASSPARNLAEGFGHFNPREFARFTRIARASLLETRNHLLDARARRYFSPEELRALLTLTARAIAASTSLLRYLDTCAGKAPTGWPK